MTVFEIQQVAILVLTVCIGVNVHRLYRRRMLTRPLMWAIMLVVGHGVLFVLVVLYRHIVLDLHAPSSLITTWSATWRLHLLGTVAGILYACLERADD